MMTPQHLAQLCENAILWRFAMHKPTWLQHMQKPVQTVNRKVLHRLHVTLSHVKQYLQGFV